jgi:hypothetical protein
MKKSEISFAEALLATFCIGIVITWIWEEEQNNKKRIQELRDRLNSGKVLDKVAIDNDWLAISQDIRRSYQTITQNMTDNGETRN